jgi:hypothetical protein
MTPKKDLGEHVLAPFNVVAVYPDMGAARKALDALERAGVEAGEISLLGKRAEEAAGDIDTRTRDDRMVKQVGKRAAAGAAAGTAAGGLVGFIAGAVAFAIPGVGPVLGAGVWASTAAGAVAGGSIGGVVGGVTSLDMTEAWELTYESVKGGRVLVGVHSDDRRNVDRGAQVLREHDAIRVERFDSRGKRLPSPPKSEG